MIRKIESLRQWLDAANHAVAFTGAGVSTDSGLNDFRSAVTGLYQQGTPYGVSPEEILTPTFFRSNPEAFFNYYRTKLLNLTAAPNYIHKAMADMEHQGVLKCVITQNADALHQRAGSENVIDFHGNVYDNECMECGKRYHPKVVASCEGVPRCGCGGIIRPNILLFGEIPDMYKVMRLVKELKQSDLLLVAGSSLQVSSAHRLLRNYKGRMVILNLDPTPYDEMADLVINEKLTPVFQMLWPIRKSAVNANPRNDTDD